MILQIQEEWNYCVGHKTAPQTKKQVIVNTY